MSCPGRVHLVYQRIGRGLSSQGLEVKWIRMGEAATAVLYDPGPQHEHEHGDSVAANSRINK